MSWKETNVRDQRVQFIGFYLTGRYSITDLCKSFGISRKTGHQLINRFNEYGLAAIEDFSRAPLSHPNATPCRLEELIKECKGNYPKWGPKKIKNILELQHPKITWPAVSTIGEILKRSGLTVTRKRNPDKGLNLPRNPVTASYPNATWCADFKGQFTLGNRKWCYPLTMTDACSRMILRCQGLYRPNLESVKPIFTTAFTEYGLPEAIRTDNGAPFSSTGLGGLSALSVWWTKLGIRLDRIDKGHPEQNGRHERMHRELKECATAPPAYDMNSQQRAFDKFRDEYNNVRPHEALGMARPASIYIASSREYPAILPEIEYPEAMTIRLVRHDGYMRWRGGMLYISELLAGEPIGLDRLDERYYALYYSRLPLAVLDDSTCQLLPRTEATDILKLLSEENN